MATEKKGAVTTVSAEKGARSTVARSVNNSNIKDTTEKKSAKKTSTEGGVDDNGQVKIQALKGPDRVRKRPSVIFGSDGIDGTEQAYFEILSNSVDEAREGHGNRIVSTFYRDLSIRVEDFGRGVPMEYNESEGRWNWDLIYCELYAGGKYNNNSAGAGYKYSLGLNGLGACATQYASDFMEVYSYDGKIERHISFKKGFPVTGELERRTLSRSEARTGTIVFWKPDREVFTNINIRLDVIKGVLRRQSMVNKGIAFVLRCEQSDGTFTEETFFYENGVLDYFKEMVGTTSITEPVFWTFETEGRDRADLEKYKFKVELVFCMSNQVNFTEYFHNSSHLSHGGSPADAVSRSFVRAVDSYIKKSPKLSKLDSGKTSFGDVSECLALISNSFSTITSYENQTKKAINNTFIKDAMEQFLDKQLEIYFTEHPEDAEKFCTQIILNKKAREKNEHEKLTLKKKVTGSIDIANRVEKFVDCRSKDPNLRELYIVEGDSALTSCKLGRSAEMQAIIPVRGKTLNCLKASYKRIFESEIITDLLKVIGCGVELDGKVQSDLPPFNIDNLRWSKIIICTDADEDGFQIRTLLLTLFYRLLPTLIDEQRVFIAETPLFEITVKDKTYFAYDEFEKASILKELGGKKYTLQRSKGLGENEPDMMWQTTMNPETRRLVAVVPADPERTEVIFDTLLGENLPARKSFIATYGKNYIKEADI